MNLTPNEWFHFRNGVAMGIIIASIGFLLAGVLL